MKLQDMIAMNTGLPAGMTGRKMKWDEVKAPFSILKAAIISSKQYNDNGELLVFSKGARQGEPIYDRQLVLQIDLEGKVVIVRTTSRYLVSLFSGNLDRPADGQNKFGDDYHFVDAPEGKMKFWAHEYVYKDGTRGMLADLEEVEE